MNFLKQLFLCSLMSMCFIATSKANGPTCTICLEDSSGTTLDKVCDLITKGRMRATQCGHHFHQRCLRKWLMRKQSCPVCRRYVGLIEWVFGKTVEKTFFKILRGMVTFGRCYPRVAAGTILTAFCSVFLASLTLFMVVFFKVIKNTLPFVKKIIKSFATKAQGLVTRSAQNVQHHFSNKMSRGKRFMQAFFAKISPFRMVF